MSRLLPAFAVPVLLAACGHAPPVPSRVVVLPLDGIGVPPARLEQMDRAIAREARQGGAIRVVDRRRARRQVETLEGCRGQRAAACAVGVGKRVQASHVVFGAVGKLGATWLLRLKLLRVNEATVARAVEETVSGSPEEVDRSLARATDRLFDLPRPSAWYARWWVWTLVGAAVTAAVVVPVVLTRGEPDPYRDVPLP